MKTDCRLGMDDILLRLSNLGYSLSTLDYSTSWRMERQTMAAPSCVR